MTNKRENSVPKGFIASPIDMLKFREIWPMGNR